MADANNSLDQTFLEMRQRCLSLAADLDRLERTASREVIRSDGRLAELRQAIGVLLENEPRRAERVQMIFTDKTSPPPHGKK